MSSVHEKRTNIARKALSWSAVLLLLFILIWKSNLDSENLIVFLIPGIVATVILLLLKRIKLPNKLILFSCIFSSLICCGLYSAFTFLFERYLTKTGDAILFGGELILASSFYSIPGLSTSMLAYPIILISVLWLFAVILSGFGRMCKKELINEINSTFNRNILFRHCSILMINLIISIVLGTLFIRGAYSLPLEKIEKNVAISAELINNEGTYPSLYKWCYSRLDNFTDSLILLEAADKNEGTGIENALLNHNGSINGCDPTEALYAHYTEGKSYDSEYAYPRYWHGNLVIVKPLLEKLNYEQIRLVNLALQTALIFLICILLAKRNRKTIIIPFLLTYLMLMPIAIGKSLQFSSCFYVSMISTAVLLCTKQEHKSLLLFLYTGAATAYFDLLTYPIITLGIPATVYLFLFNNDSITKNIVNTFRVIMVWCLGYAGMWISKWIIAEAFTGYSAVSDSIKTILMRTSDAATGEEIISVFSVFGRNIIAFLFTPIIIPVTALIFILIIKRKKENLKSSTAMSASLICVLPFIWYAFAANHSYIHYWFTNKALAVSMFALLCCLSDTTEKIYK